jgi:hypothetical protein
VAEVGVDDDDAILRPAEGDGPLAEAVLALGALGILEDLPHGRLADIEIGVPLEMTGGDFLGGVGIHRPGSFRWPRATLTSTRTTAVWISFATRGAAPGWPADATGAAPPAPRAIPAASPSRRNTTRPLPPPKAAPVGRGGGVPRR